MLEIAYVKYTHSLQLVLEISYIRNSIINYPFIIHNCWATVESHICFFVARALVVHPETHIVHHQCGLQQLLVAIQGRAWPRSWSTSASQRLPCPDALPMVYGFHKNLQIPGWFFRGFYVGKYSSTFLFASGMENTTFSFNGQKWTISMAIFSIANCEMWHGMSMLDIVKWRITDYKWSIVWKRKIRISTGWGPQDS